MAAGEHSSNPLHNLVASSRSLSLVGPAHLAPLVPVQAAHKLAVAAGGGVRKERGRLGALRRADEALVVVLVGRAVARVDAVDHDGRLRPREGARERDEANLADAVAGVGPAPVGVRAALGVVHERLHERREPRYVEAGRRERVSERL
eukprot:4783649-Prymnesium_polylepis.1